MFFPEGLENTPLFYSDMFRLFEITFLDIFANFIFRHFHKIIFQLQFWNAWT